MDIKNKKTKVIMSVTTAEWQAMIAKDLSQRFTVVSDIKPIVIPAEVTPMDYQTALTNGKNARKEENWVVALEWYKKAQGIKPTAKVQDIIDELQEKLPE